MTTMCIHLFFDSTFCALAFSLSLSLSLSLFLSVRAVCYMAENEHWVKNADNVKFVSTLLHLVVRVFLHLQVSKIPEMALKVALACVGL
jgi:uncharacterized membrane protein